MNDNFLNLKEVAEVATIAIESLSEALMAFFKTITDEYAKVVESFQRNLSNSKLHVTNLDDILKAIERVNKPLLFDKNLCYNNYRKMHNKPMYRSRAYYVYLKKRKRK